MNSSWHSRHFWLCFLLLCLIYVHSDWSFSAENGSPRNYRCRKLLSNDVLQRDVTFLKGDPQIVVRMVEAISLSIENSGDLNYGAKLEQLAKRMQPEHAKLFLDFLASSGPHASDYRILLRGGYNYRYFSTSVVVRFIETWKSLGENLGFTDYNDQSLTRASIESLISYLAQSASVPVPKISATDRSEADQIMFEFLRVEGLDGASLNKPRFFRRAFLRLFRRLPATDRTEKSMNRIAEIWKLDAPISDFQAYHKGYRDWVQGVESSWYLFVNQLSPALAREAITPANVRKAAALYIQRTTQDQ